MTRPEVQNALAAGYRDCSKRLGNPRVKDSAMHQIDALAQLMGDAVHADAIRAALKALKQKIGRE